MMANEKTNSGYDWNDEITYSDEHVDLPDGDYDFTVDYFERAQVSSESKNYAGQNMAKVHLLVHSEQGDAKVTENFILNANFAWKLSQFFVAIGLMEDKEGATLRMNWNDIGGRNGRLRIGHRSGRDNQKYMCVNRFLKPEAGQVTANQSWKGGF